MDSLYFIVGTLKANVPMVRVLDVVSGVFKDMTVENLVGCIQKNMLHIENATVEDNQLVMLDGALDNYGVIVLTEQGAKIDPVAVVVGEIVDDDNEDIIIGYRLGNADGCIYNYLIQDIQTILRDYPIANGEVFEDEQGIYWVKKGKMTFPKIKRSTLLNNTATTNETQAEQVVENKVETPVEKSVEEKSSVADSVAPENSVTGKPVESKPMMSSPFGNNAKVESVEKPAESKPMMSSPFGNNATSQTPVEKPVESKPMMSSPFGNNTTETMEKPVESKPMMSSPFGNSTNEGSATVSELEKVESSAIAKVDENTEDNSTKKYSDMDWVVVTRDGSTYVGELEDIASDCGLGKSFTIENGALLSDVDTGNDNIVSIKLPRGITSLGSNIFREFKLLETVELPRGLKTIGIETFAHCKALREVKGTMLKIGRGAFIGCGALESIDLSNTSNIDDYAFSKCVSLHTLNLKQIDVLGTGVFFGSGLTTVTLGSSLRDCGAVLFANCAELTDVIFEKADNLTTMMEHNYRLYNNVTKAEGVLDISFACMFLNCAKLENVNINTDMIPKYNNYMFKGSSLYMTE